MIRRIYLIGVQRRVLFIPSIDAYCGHSNRFLMHYNAYDEPNPLCEMFYTSSVVHDAEYKYFFIYLEISPLKTAKKLAHFK